MKVIVAFLLCSLAATIYADTELKVVENGGETQIISIQDEWLRIGIDAKDKDYLIGDLKQGVIYIVMPGQKKILALHPSADSVINNEVKSELREKGQGPDIAGYATQKYILFADGQACGTTFISEQAAKNADINTMLTALSDLNIESMLPEGMEMLVQGVMDPCAKAGMQTINETTQLGLPMKVVDEKTKSGYEVVVINGSATLDSSIFMLPADFEHTTPQKMMNDAIQEAMKQISPEQQKMIQDMLQQMMQ